MYVEVFIFQKKWVRYDVKLSPTCHSVGQVCGLKVVTMTPLLSKSKLCHQCKMRLVSRVIWIHVDAVGVSAMSSFFIIVRTLGKYYYNKQKPQQPNILF